MRLLAHKPNLQPQIIGVGKDISKIFLSLDFSESTFRENKFIVNIKFVFKGEPYFFSRIYTVSQIDDEGYLDIGEIVLLGTYTDESELEDFQVTLTYLSSAVS